MMIFKTSKIAFAVILSASAFTESQIVFALETKQSDTIYSTSILWQNEADKSKLLSLAPGWSDDVVTSLFNVYRQTQVGQSSTGQPDTQYNVKFINTHWGPLDNPFVKYQRPAKVFVMFDGVSNANGIKESIQSYMAPLIMNQQDQQYYVFDRAQSKPMLINDWVHSLQAKHSGYQAIKFNVCKGYGDLPSDSCSNKSYMDEVRDGDGSIDNNRHEYKQNLKSIPSARRDIRKDWKTYLAKSSPLASTRRENGSIYESSLSWDDQDARYQLLDTVTQWPNYQVIQANFEKMRDLRYFQDGEVANFARRISWLYPDDGCWTRASSVIRDLFGPFNNITNAYARPSKVFAFGNLCANTTNSPEGYVAWWYHTAPIVRDAETNQTYVLDPSMDPYHPMAMEKWAEAIAANSGVCSGSESNVNTFNICNGYGTSPYEACQSDYANETSSMLMQREYQYYERERQLDLGRDPAMVLGDLPPWRQS